MSDRPLITVIICTHNPNFSRLQEVLDALRSQTLSVEKWELLLIDNASKQELSSQFSIAWHPLARFIKESQLGLTRARTRGMSEASADVLCFVDDDNLLAPDYLENAWKVSEEQPHLGSWGGAIAPRFETEPPSWTRPYWPFLAIRAVDRDLWSNFPSDTPATPCGAGLCIRRVVAEKYQQTLATDVRRLDLDRIGASLSSCGDTDLALSACDINLGTGVFACLSLTHIIPPGRVEEHYLSRLLEGIVCSGRILNYLRSGELPAVRKSKMERLIWLYSFWRMTPQGRRMAWARRQGEKKAAQTIARMSASPLVP